VFGDKISDLLAILRSALWRFVHSSFTPFLYIIDQRNKYLTSQKIARESAVKLREKILNTIYDETGDTGKLIDSG